MDLFIVTLLGLVTGILINRAADFLPARSTSGFFEPPACLQCGTPRTGLDQIALLDLVLSRGRCRNCHTLIQLREPGVEIVSALAFAFLWTQYGWSIRLLLTTVYTALFLLVLVIDFEHRLILNVVILPATLLALVASPWYPFGVGRALLGGAMAYLIVFLIYEFAHVFARLRKHSIAVPFGFGDVKLAGFMGLVTGFPAVFSALLVAILLGGIGAIAFLLYHAIVHRRIALGAAIPYGPFFCLAGWAFMILT